MQRKQPGLQDPVPPAPAGQRADAGAVQGRRLQQQHRDQQVRLITEGEPLQSGTGPRAPFGKGHHADHDVGVSTLRIRVGVMPVVLAGPPAEAQPGRQIAAHHPEDVVSPPGAEDLLVTRVMPEETDLGEHHRQEHRGPQLPPRVPEQRERRPPGR